MARILRSGIMRNPFYHYFLLHKSPNSTISDLVTDTNINTTLRRLKHHKWSKGEVLHYGFLSSVLLFVFIIFPASFLIKLPIAFAFILCFLIPLTSQFFLHALPVFAWLALYFSCSKIPTSWKPAISVKVLPAMETILYGDDLSNVLAAKTTTPLDILAWIPYGIIHFSFPFIVAALVFIFGPPTALRSFAFAFGYMNLFGVMMQIFFPAASPWYKNLYGLEPANYSMHGSPGGLGRIDALLGMDTYTTAFSNSPVIFGAFPSLHSGCATMDVLFLCYLFPRFKAVWLFYACWLWWSTMYLTHHYFVDLVGGAMLSFTVFEFAKYKYLPKCDPTKFCRWAYNEIELVDIGQIDPLSSNYVYLNDDESRLYTRIYPENVHIQQVTISAPSSSSRTNTSQQQEQQPIETFEMANLASVRDEEAESDVSSTSNTPSVFEEPNIPSIYTASSATSLDEIEAQSPSSYHPSTSNAKVSSFAKTR